MLTLYSYGKQKLAAGLAEASRGKHQLIAGLKLHMKSIS
jgi:hypothetical protein